MKIGKMVRGVLGFGLILSGQAVWSQEGEQGVPTLYISINMDAPEDQKVVLKVVESARPVQTPSRVSNPRYVTVRVYNKWKRDFSNPADRGPLVGVIDAENPFLPLIDVALLGAKAQDVSTQTGQPTTQEVKDTDPITLIGKMKLVMRLSLEGREALLENIRNLRQNSNVTEADLRAELKDANLKRKQTSEYSKALREFYIKVVQPGAEAVINKFKIAEIGPKEARRASLKQAKKIFFDTISAAALKDSAIESLLSDYTQVSENLKASKGEIK